MIAHAEKHVTRDVLGKILNIGKVRHQYNIMRDRFLSEYTGKKERLSAGAAASLFRKSYASNIIYDLQLNGFKTEIIMSKS